MATRHENPDEYTIHGIPRSFFTRKLQAALDEPVDAPDVPHDDDAALDSPPVPWPLFVAMLLANGWFLRPIFFDQRPGSDTIPKRQRNAMLRIPLFLAMWVAAALLLPAWGTALLFAAWLVKVTPGIRMIHAVFQNIRPDEEPVVA